MCVTTIADDVTFDLDDALGAYRVQIVQRGQCEVEIVVSQAVMQVAIHRAIKAMEEKAGRAATVIAFPLPRAHADTA